MGRARLGCVRLVVVAGEGGGVEAGSADLAVENARLRAQLVEAHAVIAELREQVAAQARVIERLGEQVSGLSARLVMGSSNSSKPPSSDGYVRSARQRRGRGAMGRRPGKQPGAPGAHLAQVAEPDAVVVHAPERCEHCDADLTDVAITGVALSTDATSSAVHCRLPLAVSPLRRQRADPVLAGMANGGRIPLVGAQPRGVAGGARARRPERSAHLVVGWSPGRQEEQGRLWDHRRGSSRPRRVAVMEGADRRGPSPLRPGRDDPALTPASTR